MSIIRIFVIFFLISKISCGQDSEKTFQSIKQNKSWKLQFEDSGTKDWKDNWFLDGLRADVRNIEQGLVFSAGPIENDDSCHAVLWTKQSFSGDIKIEYDYTRLDSRSSQVNILYIQATGNSSKDKDIYQWKDERIIPSMRKYFDYMNAIHISYAAFGDDQEYVRARRYPRKEGQKFSLTEIPPSYYETGLFKTGITYHITIIKRQNQLYFHVDNKGKPQLFYWQLRPEQMLDEGRVGLRHMYTRSSLYGNFKIYTSN